MLRTFIATPIVPPQPVRKVISRLNLMGGGLRPASPSQLHVTLKFLGDTDETLLPAVEQALRRAVADEPPCDVPLVGIGVFPDLRRPAVLWIGLPAAEVLHRIADRLAAALDPLGFPPERRKFHPHLTLLRIRAKPPQALRDLIAEHAETHFGSVRIDAVELFQSELAPQGAKHTRLASVPLASR